ncbi:hypothetical protein OSB04_002358 [Centaurea solstitialis]|uniref:Uncharacterized protein n=1 Tax=Centaurea solstitialis TaxID=347529 RepID=A0AA38WMP8_9ASTR|nr:hypothetical protein OSB04_002358 [Centaurea solstitialis]
MAPDKVTIMILNVDLKCSCCYKKVKKLLCKFPQIRDQVFDVDKNKVRITVVCCSPEKVRDKLCCKGGKAIQSIEILEDKPKPTPKPTEEKPKPSPPVVVPTPVPVPAPKPKPADPPPPKVDPPKPAPKPDPPKPADPPPKVDPPKPAPKPDPPKQADPPPPPKVDPPKQVDPHPVPFPMPGYCPPAYPVPIAPCCQECYEGRSGGPCFDLGYNNYGRPVPPPPGPCYDGYGYQYGRNRPCYVRCDYFSEENPQGCSIM